MDDRRRGLGLWLHNNLAEQTGASIYRSFEQRFRIWKRNAGGRREGWVTGASYHGGHWLTSYSGYNWVLVACHNMVNQLRHGTVATNGDFHGEDHLAMSRRKWVRWQGGHSAPTSSLTRDLLPYVVIRAPPGTNRNAGEDHGTGSPVVRYTAPDFIQLLYHWNHSSECLTEQIERLRSIIFMWQLHHPSVAKLLLYNLALIFL
jgi:hypothetical protein